MPSVSVWKFVDRPEASPTTLLDMNNGATWRTLSEGFDVSPPPLRRSIVTNNLTDGGIVSSANYELRELKFTLILAGATEDARNAQMKSLEAELSKPANLLMFQEMDSSFPVFFRTFRSDTFALDREYSPIAWEVNCAVLAEPFAIGIRHDIVASATVNNDPAAATNPMRLDITDVRGDSPAPAFARVGSGFGANSVFAMAQRTANNPTGVTVFAQAEAGTMGTDTTTQPNDAAMSGAGNNFARCTFATNTLITRVTVTVPTASSSEALRGRYRVFVRLRRSAGSTYQLRYKISGVSPANGPLTSYTALHTNTFMLDLGIAEFPAPGPVPASIGYSGLPAGFNSQALEIQAQRVTGASTLDFDFIYLLPADERQCSFQQVDTPNSIVLDGPNDMIYGMASGSTPFAAALVNRTVDNGGGLMPRQGGLPVLVPGVTNRWHILRPTQGPTSTSVWDVSYWPRWREVATS